MRNPRFYDPQPLCEGADIELSSEVAQHIGKVLRMRSGEKITLFNGNGIEFQAELTAVDKRKVSAKLLSQQSPTVESPLQVSIGQTLSRGERMDYAIQKSTELGVHTITPLFSERCEVKLPKDRQEKRVRHWQQISISACEQSGRSVPPDIAFPQPLDEWLKNQTADIKLVLHHHSEQPLAEVARPETVALLIGPEGGLTEEEVELATSYGFKPLALGPRVMRTETAPVAALSVLNYLWGDFS